MAKWRVWAVIAGALIFICGLALWMWGGGLFMMICGLVVAATAILEPAYGRLVQRPAGHDWRATDEKFIDPETGLLVTVWYDPVTGDRRYVSDERPTGAA
jgi:hypothetical protein